MSGPAPDISLEAARRRGVVALAGHGGDEAAARRALSDPEPAIRATALAALARLGAAGDDDVAAGAADPDPAVRRRACAVAVTVPGVDLAALLHDPDDSVVETAAWALGERGEGGEPILAGLATVARTAGDALSREAAVAALGAIGDPAGLDAVLAGLSDKPAVRRRAVVALAAFEGPRVEAALQEALGDRDWQVRQAAEDLLAAGEAPA